MTNSPHFRRDGAADQALLAGDAACGDRLRGDGLRLALGQRPSVWAAVAGHPHARSLDPGRRHRRRHRPTPEIGTLVTPVGMRNPAHTGKMIATVDNIAGGRIIPGFGSGWMAREFSDFGMPFVSTRDRLRQLEEGLQIFQGMFDPDQDEFSFEGEFFHTENLVTQPKPPRDNADPRRRRRRAGHHAHRGRSTPTSGTTPPAPRTTWSTRCRCCTVTRSVWAATPPRSASRSSAW